MKNTNSRGQAMVELALVLPLFLIVVLGIIDFGINLHVWATLNQQCVQAARAGTKRINQLVARDMFTPSTHAPLSDVETAFWHYRSPLMPAANYQNITFDGVSSFSQTVTVRAQFNATLYTPFLGSMVGSENGDGKLTLTAVASERKE